MGRVTAVASPLLQVLFQSAAPEEGGEEAGEDGPTPPASSMGASVARMMAALLSGLEAKSRQYKSPALAALFLVNNVQYMAVTVER